MTRTLIVEDELLARTGLRMLIDWESYGFELLPDAVDGEEAYRRILKERPDLVLLDLNIPKISGQRLLELLDERHVRTKVIVCSCDTLFESAVSVMRSGASYYLMKYGLTKEELLKALDKVVGINHKEKEAPAPKQESKGVVPFQTVPEEFREGVVVYVMAPPETVANPVDLHIIADACGQYFARLGFPFSLFSYEYGFLVFVRCSHIDQETCRQLQMELEVLLGSRCPITYSDGMRLEDEWVYRFVRVAWAYRFHDDEAVIRRLRKELPERGKPRASDFSHEFQEIRLGLSDMDEKRVLGGIDAILTTLKGHPCDSASSLRQIFVEMLSCFSRQAGEIGGNIDEISLDGHTNHLQMVVRFSSFARVGDWFHRFVSLYVSHFFVLQRSTKSALVKSALEYIQAHEGEPISLSETAEALHTSDSYLSSQFCQVMGETFIHYVTRRKMERAKELLASGSLVGDVAERVGFSDVSYFSKVYKKYQGLSPEAYVKSLGK